MSTAIVPFPPQAGLRGIHVSRSPETSAAASFAEAIEVGAEVGRLAVPHLEHDPVQPLGPAEIQPERPAVETGHEGRLDIPIKKVPVPDRPVHEHGLREKGGAGRVDLGDGARAGTEEGAHLEGVIVRGETRGLEQGFGVGGDGTRFEVADLPVPGFFQDAAGEIQPKDLIIEKVGRCGAVQGGPAKCRARRRRAGSLSGLPVPPGA